MHGCRYLSLINGDPVGAAEPLVVLDVSDAVFEVSEALCEIDLKQILQQILQFVREM